MITSYEYISCSTVIDAQNSGRIKKALPSVIKLLIAVFASPNVELPGWQTLKEEKTKMKRTDNT